MAGFTWKDTTSRCVMSCLIGEILPNKSLLGLVAHTCNPSTLLAEAERSL